MIRYAYYSIEEQELLYGPGRRLVLWVQGCSLHCVGCTNYALWNKNGGKETTDANLVKLVLDSQVCGITLLGGEPMEQSEELSQVVKNLTQRGLSIVTFSGYEKEELITASQKYIADNSDFLICGRYIASKRNMYLQFRGSTNQTVYFPTGKYRGYQLKDGHNVALLSITEDGVIACKGYQTEELHDLVEGLTQKG